MRILCIADDMDRLVYSQHIKDNFADVDAVISAGDLSLRYYEFIVSSLNKPLFFVFGNHNLQEFDALVKASGSSLGHMSEYTAPAPSPSIFCGGELVDGKVLRDKRTGLIIVGLGGSYNYNNGKHQYTDHQMMSRIFKMVPKLLYNKLRYGRYLDILVTHAPPLGFNDEIDRCHRGFSAFLTFMDWFKPKYLLHGHVHLTDSNARRVVYYKRTKIINIYKSYILDDDTIGKKRRETGKGKS
ncbi:MAG: metallophosphoesterase [Spirochaetia bacterium]|jgi:hypothetical protein|nr:metallophosphoesterase [Spirochaetia bacterium]